MNGRGMTMRMMDGMKPEGARHTLGRDLFTAAAATGVLLLAPLVAMRFSRAVDWGGVDFALAALLLGGAGFAGLRLMRLPGPLRWRVAAVATLVLLSLYVWAELALGVFFQLGS